MNEMCVSIKIMSNKLGLMPAMTLGLEERNREKGIITSHRLSNMFADFYIVFLLKECDTVFVIIISF